MAVSPMELIPDIRHPSHNHKVPIPRDEEYDITRGIVNTIVFDTVIMARRHHYKTGCHGHCDRHISNEHEDPVTGERCVDTGGRQANPRAEYRASSARHVDHS